MERCQFSSTVRCDRAEHSFFMVFSLCLIDIFLSLWIWWVDPLSATVLRLFCDYSATILRLFCDCSATILRLFCDYSATVLGLEARQKRRKGQNSGNTLVWSQLFQKFGALEPNFLCSSCQGLALGLKHRILS